MYPGCLVTIVLALLSCGSDGHVYVVPRYYYYYQSTSHEHFRVSTVTNHPNHNHLIFLIDTHHPVFQALHTTATFRANIQIHPFVEPPYKQKTISVTKQSDAEHYTEQSSKLLHLSVRMIEQLKTMKIRGRLHCNNSALPNPMNGVTGRCNPINRDFCLFVWDSYKKH